MPTFPLLKPTGARPPVGAKWLKPMHPTPYSVVLSCCRDQERSLSGVHPNPRFLVMGSPEPVLGTDPCSSERAWACLGWNLTGFRGSRFRGVEGFRRVSVGLGFVRLRAQEVLGDLGRKS